MITLYTLPDCQNCQEVKRILNASGRRVRIRPMDTAESQTELRINGCFLMEAPVIEYEGVFMGYDEFMKEWMAGSFLNGGIIHNQKEIPQIDGQLGDRQ